MSAAPAAALGTLAAAGCAAAAVALVLSPSGGRESRRRAGSVLSRVAAAREQPATAPAAGAEPHGVGLTSPTVRLLLAVVGGTGAAVMVGGVVGVLAGAVAAGVLWRVVGRLESPALRRRREAVARQLPHAVDLMASCLAVGTSPTRAVELVADAVEPPMADELALIAGRLALGVDPRRVWGDVATRPQLGALGRCLVRAIDSGASVAEAMHRLADELRRDQRAAVEARARAVGVKATAPLGLCLLPAFVVVGIVPLIAGSLGLLLLP
ncbi:MAG TPA: type II secretion system F family protein [Nocardioidaceae bacterium]|nr:type II secretion system F family protein [Nocardioidaceae bacterium]